MMSRNSLNKRDWLTVDKLIDSMSIDGGRMKVSSSGTKVGTRGAGKEEIEAKVSPGNRKESASSIGTAQRGMQREELSNNNRKKEIRTYEYDEDIEETGLDDDSTGDEEDEDDNEYAETGRGGMGRIRRRDRDHQTNPESKSGRKAVVPSHLNASDSPHGDSTYYGYSRSRPTPPATGDEDRHLYEVKIFLQKMRAVLLKRASEMRAHDRLPRGLFKHGQHSSALFEEISRYILLKDFEPHVLKSSRGQNRDRDGVDFQSFCLVLKKYLSPGSQPLSEVAARILHTRCTADRDRGEKAQNKADPSVLLDLVFCKGGVALTEFGFTRLVPAASSTGRHCTVE
jgi:hypothetical protein